MKRPARLAVTRKRPAAVAAIRPTRKRFANRFQKRDNVSIVYTLPSGKALTQLELDSLYNNGSACAHMLPAWAARSKEASKAERASVPSEYLDLRYGKCPEERIDFLPACSGSASAPTLVWIHGGYWQKFNPKEDQCFIATALRSAGANVAIIEYSCLTTPTSKPLSIGKQSEQVLRAVTFVADKLANGELVGDPGRLVVAGHSAGGHLTGVCAMHPSTRSRLKGAVCISMLSDLLPISLSFLNGPSHYGAGVALTAEEVEKWSPVKMINSVVAGTTPPITIVVGGAELAELQRQSSEFYTASVQGGHTADLIVVEGANHFSVLDGLTSNTDSSTLYAATYQRLFT